MDRLLDLVNFLAVLVLSTACHEYAHARLADRFGDDTPRSHGRLSLNPFVHVHPVYTILLPAVLYWTSGSFMAAAWTPVNPFRMRHPRVHGLLTSLGGPATNFALALLCLAAACAYVVALGGIDAGQGRELRILGVMMLGVELNIFLGVFNFLPVPPLDGGDLVGFLLPARLQPSWYAIRRWAWIPLMLLAVTGVLGRLVGPPTRAVETLAWGSLGLVNDMVRNG